jgi:flagellar hook-length control protein FliK
MQLTDIPLRPETTNDFRTLNTDPTNAALNPTSSIWPKAERMSLPAGLATADLAAPNPMAAPGSPSLPTTAQVTPLPLGAETSAAPADTGLHAANQVRDAILNRRGDHFSLRLDPPELGTVRIELDLSRTGQARIFVHAADGSTLDLLREHGDSLASDLSRQGFTDVDIAWGKDGRERENPSRFLSGANDDAVTGPAPQLTDNTLGDGRLDWKV